MRHSARHRTQRSAEQQRRGAAQRNMEVRDQFAMLRAQETNNILNIKQNI